MIPRRAQNGAQLRLEQNGPRQTQADRPQAERGVVLRRHIKITDLLVRADIQRADDDLSAIHGLHDRFVAFKQLVLGRVRAAAQIQKFAPEKPHALRAAFPQQRQIVRARNIGVKADRMPVLRDARGGDQLPERYALRLLRGDLRRCFGQRLFVRVERQRPGEAVQNRRAPVQLRRHGQLRDSRNAERPRQNAHVGIRRAARGQHPAHEFARELHGLAGGQLLGGDEAGLGDGLLRLAV